MSNFINIADLTDPEDYEGRTYREVNMLKPHKISIGSLVELESGARLFVSKLTRDCDGTPLYTLTVNDDSYFKINGCCEDHLKVIKT
jgi:hypothetical protein